MVKEGFWIGREKVNGEERKLERR